ncbi:MAG: hypothetical protein HYV07_19985 [Deltaproteobacteria bacterium]|nr:hypothetical protein [Deltaproteobacteria bacterium]
MVLDASSTLFEQAVAKGPGADYLVAAVRTGHVWRFEVEPSDETAFGELVGSATITVVDGSGRFV